MQTLIIRIQDMDVNIEIYIINLTYNLYKFNINTLLILFCIYFLVNRI